MWNYYPVTIDWGDRYLSCDDVKRRFFSVAQYYVTPENRTRPLFIIRLLVDQLERNVLVMSKYQACVVQPLKPTNHVQTAIPSGMISRQPAMRMTKLIVLGHVELIRGPDERTVIGKIDLHDTEPRSMSG